MHSDEICRVRDFRSGSLTLLRNSFTDNFFNTIGVDFSKHPFTLRNQDDRAKRSNYQDANRKYFLSGNSNLFSGTLQDRSDSEL